MRLIDADALIELLRHNKEVSADTGDKVIAVDIDTVIRCVANQPTAYDVDKVIDEVVKGNMEMTESEKNLWLDGDDGLKPYLRMKDKGMPKGKVEQMAWLLLNGGLCGFCKVCRDEPCNIKDGESCTDNIADYIRECVRNEEE